MRLTCNDSKCKFTFYLKFLGTCTLGDNTSNKYAVIMCTQNMGIHRSIKNYQKALKDPVYVKRLSIDHLHPQYRGSPDFVQILKHITHKKIKDEKSEFSEDHLFI